MGDRWPSDVSVYHNSLRGNGEKIGPPGCELENMVSSRLVESPNEQLYM